MNISAITVRYATAVFSLGKEQDMLAALKNDMELISSVCRESADFMLLLESPIVKTSEKIKIIKLIFENKISELSLNFLNLITGNNREIYIPDIVRNVLAMIRREKNIKTAVITTAHHIDEETLGKAQKAVESELQTRVELTGKVNPHIIGGIILRIDDRQYDASISAQLKKLKKEMLKTR